MAIAANDGESGLSDAKFGADNVDDALIALCMSKRRTRVSRQFSVTCEIAGAAISSTMAGSDLGNGWNGMIDHGEGEVRSANLSAGGFSPAEKLEGRCLRESGVGQYKEARAGLRAR